MPRSKNGFWPTVLTLNGKKVQVPWSIFSGEEKNASQSKWMAKKTVKNPYQSKVAILRNMYPCFFKFNTFHWKVQWFLRQRNSPLLGLRETTRATSNFLERTPRYSRPFAQSHSQGPCILRMRGSGGNWRLVDGTVPRNWFGKDPCLTHPLVSVPSIFTLKKYLKHNRSNWQLKMMCMQKGRQFAKCTISPKLPFVVFEEHITNHPKICLLSEANS